MRQAIKSLRTRQRRCQCCGELFTPDPRTKDRQRYCSKQACQTRRQRLNESTWRIKNPDCLDYQREQSRSWHKARPNYSRKRRSEYPRILVKNSNDTRVRMRSIRSQRPTTRSSKLCAIRVPPSSDVVSVVA